MVFLNRPRTGSALAEVLRSNLPDRPVPFALYSKDLDSLPGGWPQEKREYVLSRLSNLDWVFEKTAESETLEVISSQITELANAAQYLLAWNVETSPEEELAKFLGLNTDAPWSSPLGQYQGLVPPTSSAYSAAPRDHHTSMVASSDLAISVFSN